MVCNYDSHKFPCPSKNLKKLIPIKLAVRGEPESSEISDART